VSLPASSTLLSVPGSGNSVIKEIKYKLFAISKHSN